MADEKQEETREVYLLFGKTGWIGGKLIDLLKEQGKTVYLSNCRLQQRESIEKELEEYKPTHVLNAAGVTGRPNVDWCEDHKVETLRTNVIGTLTLIDVCCMRGIHVTNFATGCIYEYDEAHPMGGAKFTEEDPPNFDGSFYSKTKAIVEGLIREYGNVLTLRLRMPISDDLIHRNFITKISKYEKIVNVPNSMTVLTDMLPVALTMATRSITGVFNFVNPGVISHNQIMDLYTQHIDPTFRYTNFTLEEQDLILKAKRSNNELDTAKLEAAVPDLTIPPIQEAIIGVFTRMRVNLLAEGPLPIKNPQLLPDAAAAACDAAAGDAAAQ